MAATMVDVMKFFEIVPTAFRKEWQELDAPAKEQLKSGIGDGTLTY